MIENAGQSEQRIVSRREFVTATVLTGAALTIAGVLPVSPTISSRAELLPETMSMDGEVQLGDMIPVFARSEMLEVQSIHFTTRKGSIRVNVRFRFVDGRLDGGATFRLKLYDEFGTLVVSQTQTEMRNRNLVVQRRSSLLPMEGDRPNRPGKAEFRFPNLAPTANVSRFTLEVWPSA